MAFRRPHVAQCRQDIGFQVLGFLGVSQNSKQVGQAGGPCDHTGRTAPAVPGYPRVSLHYRESVRHPVPTVGLPAAASRPPSSETRPPRGPCSARSRMPGPPRLNSSGRASASPYSRWISGTPLCTRLRTAPFHRSFPLQSHAMTGIRVRRGTGVRGASSNSNCSRARDGHPCRHAPANPLGREVLGDTAMMETDLPVVGAVEEGPGK